MLLETEEFNVRINDPEAWKIKIRLRQKEERAILQRMRDEAKIHKFLNRKKTMLGSMKTGQQSRYKGSKGGVLFDDLKMKATDII